MIGASAAMSISGLPFAGPIGVARVGYIDGNYVLNPTTTQMESSQLDLVVSGTGDAVLMVESEAKELPEDVMLGAVMFGHEQQQVVISTIREFAAQVNTPAMAWTAPAENTALIDAAAAAGGRRHHRRLQDRRQAGPLCRCWTPSARKSSSKLRHQAESDYTAEEVKGAIGSSGEENRAQPYPRRRAPHRWPRHGHRASRSASAPACCRAPTVPHCSPAARPRRWW